MVRHSDDKLGEFIIRMDYQCPNDIYIDSHIECSECMSDAPHNYCCRQECGEHEFCRFCDWKPKNYTGGFMGVCIETKHCDFTMDMGYGSFYRLRNKIAEYVPENPNKGTINFLEQSDCDGKLTYKECKELLSDIENMDEPDDNFGYTWSMHRKLNDFKVLLDSAIKYRCNLYWR